MRAAWLSGASPARQAARRAGRPGTGWQAAGPAPVAPEADAASLRSAERSEWLLHTIGSGSLSRAESDLRPMDVIHAEALAEDAARTADGQADPFSPEDRDYLADEAQRLGVTPELVAQRLGTIEDPDGLWRDREAGE